MEAYFANLDTVEQLIIKVVNEASTKPVVFIYADETFPLIMRSFEAVKQNPNIIELAIGVKESLSREILDILVDLLATKPTMTSIRFKHLHIFRTIPGSTVINTDYTMLVESIATSTLEYITAHGDLPLELEAAIIEGLRRKLKSTTLRLESSPLIMNNSSSFSDLLTSGNGLGCLQLRNSLCHDIDGQSLWEGLQNTQSLRVVNITQISIPDGLGVDTTIKFLMKALRHNQSLLKFDVCGWKMLDAEAALLLNQLISTHDNLAYLAISDSVFVDPDAFCTFCDTVSRNPSVAFLEIFKNRISSNSMEYLSAAVSQMLQETASMQVFVLPCIYYKEAMDELAVGINGCKSLTLLDFDPRSNAEVTWGFIKLVIANPNITRIYCSNNKVNDNAQLTWDKMELDFYVAFNKHGRSLVRHQVAECLWPYALAKAGSSSLPDALYFFIQAMPQLVH